MLNDFVKKQGITRIDNAGPVMELIREFQPQSRFEWYERYSQWTKGEGKDYLERLNQSLDVALLLAPWIQPEELYEAVRKLVIHDTWDGYQRELKGKEFLKKAGIVAAFTQGHIDNKYAIDFYCALDDFKFGVQVKPSSFFESSHPLTEQRRWNEEDKMNEYTQVFRQPAYNLVISAFGTIDRTNTSKRLLEMLDKNKK